MIRAIVLVLLTTISATGQDSTFVREFCNKLGQFADTADIDSQISSIVDMAMKYSERNPIIGDDPVQDALRFQYRLNRELKKTCPNWPGDRARFIPKSVFDLEEKLNKQQIDSLDILISQIKHDKKVHLYIVTIDDFYPDSTIVDFSDRYRDFWAPRQTFKKGVVMIVFSTKQREIRISTGDISGTYLTDTECEEALKPIIPHFKNTNYFKGLVEGLFAIKSRL